MNLVELTRHETGPFGTFGEITTPSGLVLKTLERPADIDHPCIYAADFIADYRLHPINGWRYELFGVNGRSSILIHPANWFEELEGCIALGATIEDVSGEYNGVKINHKGVTHSKASVAMFEADMKKLPFILRVGWA